MHSFFIVLLLAGRTGGWCESRPAPVEVQRGCGQLLE